MNWSSCQIRRGFLDPRLRWWQKSISQPPCGGILGDLGATAAHRDTNVGLTQGRGVVDAVAGRRRACWPAMAPTQLLPGRNPGKHAGCIPGLRVLVCAQRGQLGSVGTEPAAGSVLSAKPHLGTSPWRCAWSPVIIFTAMPALWQAATADDHKASWWIAHRLQAVGASEPGICVSSEVVGCRRRHIVTSTLAHESRFVGATRWPPVT